MQETTATMPPEEAARKPRLPQDRDEAIRYYGPVGPGSMLWRLAMHPAIHVLSVYRAGILQMSDPAMARAGTEHDKFLGPITKDVYDWPKLPPRLQTGIAGIYDILFATDEGRRDFARRMKRRHLSIRGHDPVLGADFESWTQQTVMWVLWTVMDSIPVMHEMLVGESMTSAERERYWNEALYVSAQFGIDVSEFPATPAESAAYWRQAKTRIAISRDSLAMLTWFSRLSSKWWLEPLRRLLVQPLVVHPVVASLDDDFRLMCGMSRSRVRDRFASVGGRIGMRLIGSQLVRERVFERAWDRTVAKIDGARRWQAEWERSPWELPDLPTPAELLANPQTANVAANVFPDPPRLPVNGFHEPVAAN